MLTHLIKMKEKWTGLMRVSTLSLWSTGIVAIGVAVYFLSFSYFKSDEIRRVEGRLSLYKNSIESLIDRFSYFPHVLAKDPHVINGAKGQGLDFLNERLFQFTQQSGVEAIYLINPRGETIATSNYQSENSYMGQNYGFRPYFKQAMTGNAGDFYGIGATTKLPGLFASQPVRNEGGDIIGVIAIKFNFDQMERLWVDSDEQVLLSNQDHIVLLSSNPQWRYKTLFPLSVERRKAITANRQFANEPLNDLNWRVWDTNQVMVNGKYYLLVSEELNSRGWRLYFFASMRPVREKTWLTLISLCVVVSVLFGVRQMRKTMHIGEELRVSKEDRAELQRANDQLAIEIEERRAAEERLLAAQAELSRASRLAALGQLSVSVTHELGQPIAAMRNYLTAAEISPNPPATTFMQKMHGLAHRMENITKQLKFFAKPGSDSFGPVDLRDVVNGVKDLLEADLQAAAVQFQIDMPDHAVMVRGDGLRLEQVLTNLMRNALNAMEGEDCKTLAVSLEENQNKAIIRVADRGVGLGDQTLDHLQEPFVSSRVSGEGLGLGLAISTEIIKEHDGQMMARNRRERGAEFAFELPLAQGGEI